jgi:hypothetical protein
MSDLKHVRAPGVALPFRRFNVWPWWLFLGPERAVRRAPCAADAFADLCQVRTRGSLTMSESPLSWGIVQQPKGGDPVSHCLSPQSPASMSWILASTEVRAA